MLNEKHEKDLISGLFWGNQSFMGFPKVPCGYSVVEVQTGQNFSRRHLVEIQGALLINIEMEHLCTN